MSLAGHVLILTGPPGAGKSTTATSLVRAAGMAAVHLHSDDFWHCIKSGYVEPYLPQAHAQNETVIDVLAGAAQGYARGGFLVVVDGIIGPWFLEPFRALSVPLHYIVLRPVLSEAVTRCQERGGDTLTDPGPIRDLHRQFSSLGEFADHSIDTAGQDRAETLSAVHAALASGRYRLRSGIAADR